MDLRDRSLGHKRLSVLRLENEELCIEILPDLGGKIMSLVRKELGTQFFHQPNSHLKKLSKPKVESKFLPPYACGFDECFPTISKSIYHFKGERLNLPDHGELWTQSWNYAQNDSEVKLWTKGGLINYQFFKKITLHKNRVKLEYKLSNLENIYFDYLWSAHPLLNIQQEDEFIFPEEISQVELNWSSDATLGTAGDCLSWPDLFEGVESHDFNKIPSKSMGFATKLFTDKLKNGKAGIYKKETNESLIFSFNVDEIPYLGIWLCYGGWPENNEKDYTVALEPCSGRPDALSEAIDRNESSKIGPGATKKWSMNIELKPGKAKLN